jgi:hypothetical protein
MPMRWTSAHGQLRSLDFASVIEPRWKNVGRLSLN